jgi:hypothetical protein
MIPPYNRSLCPNSDFQNETPKLLCKINALRQKQTETGFRIEDQIRH